MALFDLTHHPSPRPLPFIPGAIITCIGCRGSGWSDYIRDDGGPCPSCHPERAAQDNPVLAVMHITHEGRTHKKALTLSKLKYHVVSCGLPRDSDPMEVARHYARYVHSCERYPELWSFTIHQP